MKIKIKSLFLTMIMLLMGIHFQSDVYAHADHDKDANVITMADTVSYTHLTLPTKRIV